MRPADIVLAIAAAVAIGYAVSTSVEAGWAGPLAGVAAFFVLIGINRFARGGRNAR